MNCYMFNFLLKPATAPVVGDASALEKLCRQIGYLIGAGQCQVDWNVRAGITTGAFVVDSSTAAPIGELALMSPFRLPSSLEPTQPNGTTTGDLVTAGAGINAVTALLDDRCNTVLSNLDKPVVTKGCLIVAYVPGGVDISDELEWQMNVPTCAGQRIVIGQSNQDALDGIYVPFTTAWAYAAIGGGSMAPVAVVNTAGISNKTPNRQ